MDCKLSDFGRFSSSNDFTIIDLLIVIKKLMIFNIILLTFYTFINNILSQ